MTSEVLTADHESERACMLECEYSESIATVEGSCPFSSEEY